ncbi:hypothetical protein RU86_GL001024 [Lactococcus piscium]|uniref:Major facilitator superfamily (MFS) profile domain-containing protein n=2 Tax=Pseudolactococcus piscium TaxID=1364 RepID=A0A2A5S5B8_9LACT|nr:hypothetical protein RU86_GL001024 [Lactococcus piscium]
MVIAGGPAASSLIPLIHASFANQSTSAIELIATIPNFGILLFVLLSNVVLKMIGRRNTVLLGLSIALISGLIPVFVDNYYLILMARFFFGVGIGMYNALAVSLITQLYSGDEQASLMGFQSALSFIGSTTMTLIVGHLTKFGWHTSFLAYLLTLLPLVLFALFVKIPESEFETTEKVEEKKHAKESINLATIGMLAFAFIIFSLFFVIMLKSATFLVETGIGKPEDAAKTLSTITMVGIGVGLLYGKIYKLLKQWVLPIGLTGMGLGFIIILFSHSVTMVMLGTIASGLFYSMAAPFLFMLVGKVAPKNSITLATSLYLVGVNLGVFLSPIINNGLSKMFHNQQAANTQCNQWYCINCIGCHFVHCISDFETKRS